VAWSTNPEEELAWGSRGLRPGQGPFSTSKHSWLTVVIAMLGSVLKGSVVGLEMPSPSGVLAVSLCLWDSGGNCKFPEIMLYIDKKLE